MLLQFKIITYKDSKNVFLFLHEHDKFQIHNKPFYPVIFWITITQVD